MKFSTEVLNDFVFLHKANLLGRNFEDLSSEVLKFLPLQLFGGIVFGCLPFFYFILFV